MTTSREALGILRRAVPSIGDDMALLVLTIGLIESHWGDHWPRGRGAGSNNWGAITAGPAWQGGTFEHEDSKWTPQGVRSYTTRFRSYASPAEGARDLWQSLGSRYTEAVDRALNGQWDRVSEALYDAGYYTGTEPRQAAIATHQGVFLRGLSNLRKELGIGAPSSPSLPPASTQISTSGLGGLLLLYLLSKLLGGRL